MSVKVNFAYRKALTSTDTGKYYTVFRGEFVAPETGFTFTTFFKVEMFLLDSST